MTKKMIFVAVFILVQGLILVSCGEKQDRLLVNDGIAARIGDKKITEEDADEIFESFSESQKNILTLLNLLAQINSFFYVYFC